jgi:hypothetical protein
VYTKEEASQIKQKFWTAFGRYMQPVPSASGEKVNWINYKTGIKGIFFKLNADNCCATATIEISLLDTTLQHLYFDLFVSLKNKFTSLSELDWRMEKCTVLEYGKELSMIFVEMKNTNIYRETDWPTLISFLKHHIMALDFFWNENKVAFELLN